MAKKYAPKEKWDGKTAYGTFTTGNKYCRFLHETKYQPEYPQMLLDYYNEPIYDEYEDAAGKKYRMTRPLPSKVGFARRIGVLISTLENWARAVDPDGNLRYPEWKAVWDIVDRYDQQNLIDASNDGVHNANFGKFLLSAKYGLREKAPDDNVLTVRIETENQAEVDEESV